MGRRLENSTGKIRVHDPLPIRVAKGYNKSSSILLASSQIMTGRLLINFESSVYSLGLFLTSSYNLNLPISVNHLPAILFFLCLLVSLSFAQILPSPLPFFSPEIPPVHPA